MGGGLPKESCCAAPAAQDSVAVVASRSVLDSANEAAESASTSGDEAQGICLSHNCCDKSEKKGAGVTIVASRPFHFDNPAEQQPESQMQPSENAVLKASGTSSPSIMPAARKPAATDLRQHSYMPPTTGAVSPASWPGNMILSSGSVVVGCSPPSRGTQRQAAQAPAAANRKARPQKAATVIIAPRADVVLEQPAPRLTAAGASSRFPDQGIGLCPASPRTPGFGSSAQTSPPSHPDSPGLRLPCLVTPAAQLGRALQEAESEEKQQNPDKQTSRRASPSKMSCDRSSEDWIEELAWGDEPSSPPPLPHTGSVQFLLEPRQQSPDRGAGPPALTQDINPYQRCSSQERSETLSPLRSECSEADTARQAIGSEAHSRTTVSYWTPGGVRGRGDRPLDSPLRKMSLDEDSFSSDSNYSPSVGSCRLQGRR